MNPMLSSLPLLSSLPAPRRRPALPALLLALLGLCALSHAASANTLTVASDGTGQYPTIQAAVNAAVNGDTVLLADGVYRGPGDMDVNFGGKNITVTSQNGAAKTVVDCGGYYASDGSGDHRGFVLQTGVISGLTIQNGYVSGIGYGDGGDTSYSDGQGGDIEVLGDGVFTVQNCVLQNSTAKFGGGLYTSGTATLTNDAFTGNSAQDGGGLFTNGTATLTDCTLTGDTAQDTGGGLYNGGTTTLTNCALTGNTVQYDGGGIYNQSYSGGTLTLTNDTLTGNTAGEYGGGLGNAQAGVATLTNDTLTGNSAQKGGGLYNFGSTATLTNDTLTGNTAQKGGGGLYNGPGGTVGLTNDILYGDTAPNGADVLNDQTYGSSTASATHCDIKGGVPRNVTNKGGNINANPLLVSPPAAPPFTPPTVGDAHLRPGSPCIRAGTPNGAPAVDKDGTVRPNPPSIGAYEIGSTLTVASDGSGQYATIQAAINAANPGNTVLLANGTYTGPGDVDLDFGGKSLTVTSRNGAVSTIIDCGGSSSGDGYHRGFYIHSGESNAVISGLTIQNGGGNQGGGIEVVGATVTVQNCVIENDAAEYGGGLDNDGGTVTLTNCALAGNRAGDGGGFFNAGTATLTNDTFTGNTALSTDGSGLYNYGAATLTNDILYDDTSGDPAGEIYFDGNGNDPNGNGTISASHCDIAGGRPGLVTDLGGNINADPKFVTPPTDLHLQPGSPCLGAGTPNGAPTITLDGQPRPNPPSIGAFELGRQTAYRVYAGNSSGPRGQTVLLDAYLTQHGGAGLAGATITFTVDGMAAGSAVTNKDGVAGTHYTVPASLSVGRHTITASFAGNNTNPPSSGTATLTVTAAYTALTVASVSGTPGQTVTLTATLRSGKAGVPGETLSFSVGGSFVGSATTNSSGVATLPYTIPAGSAAGGQPISVTFAGDGSYFAATGAGTLAVKSATALAVASVTGSRGATVTLSATLTSGGVGVSGKSVTFTVDGRAVGTATTDGNGVASLGYVIPSSDKVGAHSVGASFAGDGSDTPSSGKGTLTVQ